MLARPAVSTSLAGTDLLDLGLHLPPAARNRRFNRAAGNKIILTLVAAVF
jgi:hypothetical protein